MAERRSRATKVEREHSLLDPELLPISIDSETSARAWHDTLRLAIARRLTTYDAAYLKLASRRHATLATLDDGLRRAAEREGLTVLGT